MLKLLGRVFALVGPGLIIASVCLGPGSVTTSSKIGSEYGYQLIWVVILSSVAMATYTAMAARFGATQERSFLQVIAESYGRWFAILIGGAAFLMSGSFQFGNNIGVATAMTQITGVREEVWPFVFTGVSLAFVLGAKNLYQVIEKLMTALVLVMVFAFFANLVVAKPDLVLAAQGLIPSVPKGALATMAAMVGTTFVVHACVYQAYLVQQKGWDLDDVRKGVRDSIVGITLLGVISTLIMLTSAAALKPKGIQVKDASDMARQLESLFGPYAKVIFCLGLWAAAFSSISVNAIVGGGLLSDGLGLGRRMDQGWPRLFALIIMLAGMLIAVFYGGNPVEALVLAQAATLLAVPAVAIGLFLVLNNRKVMGIHANNLWQNALAVFGLLLILVMSYTTYGRLVAKIQEATQGTRNATATPTPEKSS